MTNNFSSFKMNNTHFIMKDFYNKDFINELYNIVFSKYSAPNTDATTTNKQKHHTVSGNYNYNININNISHFEKFQDILNDFNNVIRNALIENNNKFISKKFSINLSDVELCVTRTNTYPTEIVKSNCINIFIPLHIFPNGGTISIFPNNLQDDTPINDIIDKYYNLDLVNKKQNYGKLFNYSDEDKDKLLNEEIFIDTYPGDVLVVNRNTFSRSIPNMSDQDRYCLQLIYDVTI